MTVPDTSWIYRAIGASNHRPELRQEDDFYATSPKAIDDLFTVDNSFGQTVWEPATGMNHLADRMERHGRRTFRTDLITRKRDVIQLDFLSPGAEVYKGMYDIITNPPYKYATEFCAQAISLMDKKCAMLLNIRFLEGQSRYKFFEEWPMKKVWVYSERLACAKDGDFDKYKGGVTAFAWFVWQKDWHGDTTIGWIKPRALRDKTTGFARDKINTNKGEK